MSKGVLVINAGSSSIKFSLYISRHGEEPHLVSKGQVEGIDVAPHFIAKSPKGKTVAEKKWNDPHEDHEILFRFMVDWIEGHLQGADLVAAGHRVVHGGLKYSQPTEITPEVLHDLYSFIPLAPLHQPHNLSPIEALLKVHPTLRQVACFDTSFHRSNPEVAQIFALPHELTEEGVRRYGFHGLSYEYVAAALRDHAPEIGNGKVVVCHLGSGASMCAIDQGLSVASTMGFTALDGLPMGTRTGTVDAGVVLYLLQEKGMDAKQIETLLYKKSGLLGVSGISNDMRVLLDSAEPRAKTAVDLFVYRIARETGSLAAALGGLDGLVFTAGIGEHSGEIRAKVGELVSWLGVEIDPEANKTHSLARISSPASKVPVYVVPTDEELMIARHVREVIHSF